jgi:alpha-1,2-mannosyltransferase
VVLFLVSFCVYAATAARQAINDDAYAASAGAWRIASTGAPYFDGVDLERVRGSFYVNGKWIEEAPNGHVTPLRSAGPIIAGVPFYLILGHDPDPDTFTVLPGGIAASFLTAGTVLLVFLTVRRKLPDPAALAVALVFGFATPTWSVSADGLWTHPLTQLGLAGAAFSASRNRWWLAGVFLGVGMFGRPHIALVAAVLGLGVTVSRRRLGPGFQVALPSIAALLLLEVWNWFVLGTLSVGGAYGDSKVAAVAQGVSAQGGDTPEWVNYAGFLFSADRGMFVWSPMIPLLIPAVVRARRELPDWTWLLAAGGVLYVFVQMRLNPFTGGDTFHAYRHGLELLTCIAPLFAFAVHRVGRIGQMVLPVVLAVQFAAFSLGAVVQGAWVEPSEVWTHNGFVLMLALVPAAAGSWLGICVLAGVLTSAKLNRDRYARLRVTGYRSG